MKTITLISLLFLIVPCGFAQSPLADSIKAFAGANHFNGTVLVQQNGKVVYHESYGLANREFQIPYTNETRNRVCSITKTFTAVLIMQLVEQKKIDLQKTIDTYLPGYKGEAGSKVTIHQLLNHTSGIPNSDTVSSISNALKYGLGPLYQRPFYSTQLVELFASGNLVAKPGERFDYNNADYFVLGLILEVMYKKPFSEILQQQILNPLGMNHSGMMSPFIIVNQLADTYFSGDVVKELIKDLPVYWENWFAAGGMFSTTTDLLKFSNALFSLKLINQQSLDQLLTPGLDDYGYSVWLSDFAGANTRHKRMMRFGSIMGANAVWTKYLNQDVTIIILSNTNQTDLGSFSARIGKVLIK